MHELPFNGIVSAGRAFWARAPVSLLPGHGHHRKHGAGQDASVSGVKLCVHFLWWSAVVVGVHLMFLLCPQWISVHAHASSGWRESVSRGVFCGMRCGPWGVFSSCFVWLSSVKPVGPSNVLSMAQLRTLPLGDQVKTLMKNGQLGLRYYSWPICLGLHDIHAKKNGYYSITFI